MAELFSKKVKLRHFYVFCLLLLFCLGCLNSTARPTKAATSPKLALAQIYQQNEPLDQYWVSEKLDGVRAYWDGEKLISRQGNQYHAPAWFTVNLPTIPLDGELWIKRGSFEQLVSTVRKIEPIDSEWRQVKYMIFDLPTSSKTFTHRLAELKANLIIQNNAHIQLIQQYKVTDHTELQAKLDHVIKLDGEGLMLHRGDSLYRAGRSSDILKVKTYQDAEAIVIAHLPGKGKYKGMLGSILVEMPDGKRFKIGGGFKDSERKTPPKVGTQITYKYFGLTRKGIPKFASFLRIRKFKE